MRAGWGRVRAVEEGRDDEVAPHLVAEVGDDGEGGGEEHGFDEQGNGDTGDGHDSSDSGSGSGSGAHHYPRHQTERGGGWARA